MTGEPSEKSGKKLSYADYLLWPDDQRWELIDGQAFAMSPAPTPGHQLILVELVTLFHNFLKNRACKVYPAPFDVRLARKKKRNDQIFNVVQPDISIICDAEKVDEKGCLGAPDLVVEILSPSTAGRDHIVKRALYEANGVKEYWLVDPLHRLVTVYRQIESGCFASPQFYDDQATVVVSAIEGLQVNLSEVFPQLPKLVCENYPPGYNPCI